MNETALKEIWKSEEKIAPISLKQPEVKTHNETSVSSRAQWSETK